MCENYTHTPAVTRNCDCCIRMFCKYFILLLLYSLTEALVRLKDPLENKVFVAWFSNEILGNASNIHVAFEEVASPWFEVSSSRTT